MFIAAGSDSPEAKCVRVETQTAAQTGGGVEGINPPLHIRPRFQLFGNVVVADIDVREPAQRIQVELYCHGLFSFVCGL